MVGDGGEVAVVAEGAQLPQHRRVEEAAAGFSRFECQRCALIEHIGGGKPAARRSVQAAQLALGPEAREARVNLVEPVHAGGGGGGGLGPADDGTAICMLTSVAIGRPRRWTNS